jgi:trk system potassium uptake protein TrkH
MQVLGLVAVRSVRRSQMPRAVLPVKLGRFAIAEDIVSRMAGFFLLYIVLVLGGLVTVTALGGDLETTLGAVVGSLGNMGPALNEAGPTANFADAFSQPARLVLAGLMLVGRLEIFPMLLMFAAPYRMARALVRR